MIQLDIIAATTVWVVLITYRSIGVHSLLALPSTILHELSHWIIAYLTGSCPSKFSFWPKRQENGWELGSISFFPKNNSASLIALAPLWVLLPIACGGLQYLNYKNYTDEIIFGLIFGYISWGSIPSSQDIFIALRYPRGLPLVMGYLILIASNLNLIQ